jgi:hypothetical protein
MGGGYTIVIDLRNI